MKRMFPVLMFAAAATAVAIAPARAVPVFDSANYSQNLLSAARALQQIDQQIRQLQNEAQMLSNMDKHLQRIDFPEMEKLKANLSRVDELMAKAEGIDFGTDQLDARLEKLFPEDISGVSRSTQLAIARARFEAAASAYRRTLGVQSRIAANVTEDVLKPWRG